MNSTQAWKYAIAAVGGGALSLLVADVTLSSIYPITRARILQEGIEQGYSQATNSLELTEPIEYPTGLLQLIAEKSGEALAVTGNGDGTTTTNNFGNIYDAALMEFTENEEIPIKLVNRLPEYGAQQ